MRPPKPWPPPPPEGTFDPFGHSYDIQEEKPKPWVSWWVFIIVLPLGFYSGWGCALLLMKLGLYPETVINWIFRR